VRFTNKLTSARKIALFGGTFDPIHCAHLAIAKKAALEYGLDRVLFVPAARPPHKRGSTAALYEDRYRMVELACEGEPLFEASRLEEGDRRSYSILTIERFKSTLAPGDELYFLIGADAFAEIQTWYRWQDVVREVAFLVVTRPGHSYALPPGSRVFRVEDVSLPVSSSEIRAALAECQASPEVPPRVLAYIRERRLYGSCSA
jgi:nicotinate-nucleotide adenylyltransferase